MIEQPLTQVLILLAASVFVVTLARRLGWPPILGYLVVGMALGPHAIAIIPMSSVMSVVPELGVVFLVFTLGLEFSLPRMVAMRREVFGLGALQVGATLGASAVIAADVPIPDETARGVFDELHHRLVAGDAPEVAVAAVRAAHAGSWAGHLMVFR